jgi:tetratricopeptide (TPR) repeat protein
MTDDVSRPGVAPQDRPTDEEIRETLAAIQASSAFSSSRQLSLFLAYIVEKALAGEGDRIKAYSIATEALGRPESFDPSVDPIVRVEAGRLRKALDAYYQGEGAGDRLRIAIPRGTYVPRFDYSETPVAAPASDEAVVEESEPDPSAESALDVAGRGRWQGWVVGILAALVLLAAIGLIAFRQPGNGEQNGAARPQAESQAPPSSVQPAAKPMAPRIFVMPFAVADEVATGVTGSQFAAKMATALARFDEVTVVTRVDGDADYVLSGTLSEAPAGITAATLLTDRQSGRVIWSSRPTAPRNPIQSSLAIDDLVGDMAVAIAQPYGVVMSDRLARTDRPDDGFPCLIRSFNYWRDFETTAHADIRECLEQLAQRYPTFALAHAMLTFTYLDEDGLGFSVRPDSPAVDKAIKSATTAVQLAPTSARAQQALQLAYFATGQLDRAIETGERAMTLNPLDTDVRAVQGMILIVTGQHQHGARLIEESASHNTAYPPWYDLYLALAAFQAGNEGAMRTLIKRVNLPGHPLAALLGLIAGGSDGSPQARQAALADLQAHFPGLAADPAKVLRRMLPNPALIDQLVAAARSAGLRAE